MSGSVTLETNISLISQKLKIWNKKRNWKYCYFKDYFQQIVQNFSLDVENWYSVCDTECVPAGIYLFCCECLFHGGGNQKLECVHYFIWFYSTCCYKPVFLSSFMAYTHLKTCWLHRNMIWWFSQVIASHLSMRKFWWGYIP